MGTEFPWRWGRGTISANLDVIWGMSVKTVIAGMATDGEIALRNQALVAFTYVTGIRDGAIASLRLKHVDVGRLLVV